MCGSEFFFVYITNCVLAQVNFSFPTASFAQYGKFSVRQRQVTGKRKAAHRFQPIHAPPTHAHACVCVCVCVGLFIFVYGKCYCLTLNFGTCLSSVRKRRRASKSKRERGLGAVCACVCVPGGQVVCVLWTKVDDRPKQYHKI